MQNFTQILYLWGPVVLAIVAVIVVSLVINSDKKEPAAAQKPRREQKAEAEPVQKREPTPIPAASALFKVVYTSFDNSEEPPLLSLQGDLVHGTLKTGDLVRAENGSVRVRINCISDYGNHIADEITMLDDCVILIETPDPDFIRPGETLIKD